MADRKLIVIVNYDPPPIPERGADWYACYDHLGEDGPIGYGATKRAAINDLLDTEDEE